MKYNVGAHVADGDGVAKADGHIPQSAGQDEHVSVPSQMSFPQNSNTADAYPTRSSTRPTPILIAVGILFMSGNPINFY